VTLVDHAGARVADVGIAFAGASLVAAGPELFLLTKKKREELEMLMQLHYCAD
jgi:hypothetical protein